jgi:hypothetical protein
MASVDDDPTIQLIDWLLERLRQCHGETLPLLADDVLKERAKEVRSNIGSAIDELNLARGEREKQLRASG